MPPRKGKKAKAAPNEAPATRGRPRASFFVRGRAKAKEKLAELFGRRTPTPDPADPGPESTTGGVRLTGDLAREAALANEEYGVPSLRQDTNTTPVWLQSIKREAAGWVLVDTINTEDIPKWFEDQVRGLICYS